MPVIKAVDEVMERLDHFGRYQAFQFLLHALAAMNAGVHMMSFVTVGAVPEHRCFIPELDLNATNYEWNFTVLLAYIPVKGNSYDSCRIFNRSEAVFCDQFVFDSSYYKSSLAVEWNLVCDRRWMGAIAQTAYFFGVFTGAVVLGAIADRVGRKRVFCWSGLLQLIFGVSVAFMPEYFSFLAVMYLYGIFGSAGAYIAGFVLTMELVGSSKRTVCGLITSMAFSFGVVLVGGWAWILHDRQLLQIIYGLHACLLIPHWWLMDESPRWLWAQGRVKEALEIVNKGLKFNKKPALNQEIYLTKTKEMTSDNKTKSNMADLFQIPQLRKRTLIVCLNWFANSLVYYGLSLSPGRLEGNPFLIICIMGLVDFPACIAAILTLDQLGRRFFNSFLLIIGGIFCIVAVQIPNSSMATTIVTLLGKICVAGSFAVIYNYTAELFPTVMRNSAIGLGSMCARLSAALAPLITLLDSFDAMAPAIIFGVIAVASGFCTLFLPETKSRSMPETLGDLLNDLGEGDTFFTTGLGKRKTEGGSDKECTTC